MNFIGKRDDIIKHYYPEKDVGGYTRVDGTLEFYARINALIHSKMSVLDFGAGRGGWFTTKENTYVQKVRLLKGKVARCVACDVDPVVLENVSVDETVVISPSERLPFEDETFDLISADYVFEHLANPQFVFSELTRVLRKNGWICARTPNKNGYISIMTRLIHNKFHKKIVSRAQPYRNEIDIFPTVFKANSLKDIKKLFPADEFKQYVYYYEAEPSYFFNNKFCFYVMSCINHVLPSRYKSTLMIFLKKI